jgi:hypothetical protein
MFLLSMRGPERGLYHFRPYDWGPFSAEVAADLDTLTLEGLLTTKQEPGRTWERYVPTPAGERRTSEMVRMLPALTVEWLGSTRRFLTTRTFAKLLTDVYGLYPEYAVHSRFRP